MKLDERGTLRGDIYRAIDPIISGGASEEAIIAVIDDLLVLCNPERMTNED